MCWPKLGGYWRSIFLGNLVLHLSLVTEVICHPRTTKKIAVALYFLAAGKSQEWWSWSPVLIFLYWNYPPSQLFLHFAHVIHIYFPCHLIHMINFSNHLGHPATNIFSIGLSCIHKLQFSGLTPIIVIIIVEVLRRAEFLPTPSCHWFDKSAWFLSIGKFK